MPRALEHDRRLYDHLPDNGSHFGYLGSLDLAWAFIQSPMSLLRDLVAPFFMSD
jgi:hypothetical protein